MEQRTAKAAALYARVSTLDQNSEVQLQDLRRYAGKRFADYCEYTDAGVSGIRRALLRAEVAKPGTYVKLDS